MVQSGKGKRKVKKLSGLDVKKALKKLLDGNRRYVRMKATHPHQTKTHLKKLEKSQRPFAVIVGCSDSRVAPEIIFDQGLGDLFVIREAGHVVAGVGLGSIEYAVAHLGVRLVLVLGHERCGAVSAAVAAYESRGEGSSGGSPIENIIKPIRAAVRKARSMDGDLLDNAVRLNVHNVVKKLESSKALGEYVKNKKLKVMGARYDMHTHEVKII